MLREELIKRQVSGLPADRALDKAFDRWQRLMDETIALLGQLGFDSIYHKSLSLAHRQLPAMGLDHLGKADQSTLSELRAALTEQTSADGCEVILTLLLNFTAVLAILIGDSLTERLLQAAWGEEPPDSNNSEQGND